MKLGRHLLPTIVSALAATTGVHAAVTTRSLESDLTVEALVQALLGTGVQVSNVRYSGALRAAGTFVGGSAPVGFDAGIILGSGAIEGIVGPNDDDATSDGLEEPGDPDLDQIANAMTYDATVLEFDFVPASETITFQYVFGSEEYNEYVNDSFDDVFAFLVNGRNYALLPDGQTPVSINQVNGGNPLGTDAHHPEFFVNNDCSSQLCEMDEDCPSGVPCVEGVCAVDTCPYDIEADGRTVVLTLIAPVRRGEVNHVKLAIADAADDAVDSWVLIRAGSFSASEVCDNGFDDDADGAMDCADPDCAQSSFCAPGVHLHLGILAPRRVSPGQTIDYVLVFENRGTEDAVGTLLFTTLDDDVEFVSASRGGHYNPVVHGVDWDVGTLRSKESDAVSMQVRAIWGLPQDTAISVHGMLTWLGDSPLATTRVADAAAGNIYVNGIGLCTPEGSRKALEFASARDALWIQAYDDCNPLLPHELNQANHVLDVIDANDFIANDNNALTDPRLASADYDTCWGYSGGTVTLTSALQSQGLRCKHLVLISPFLTSNGELEGLITSGAVQEITIFQSDTDFVGGLGQYKIGVANEWFSNPPPWLHVVDLAGVGHTDWIYCLNNGEKATGGTFFCDPEKIDESGADKSSAIDAARDPNAKLADRRLAEPGEEVNFTIDFENEGAGIAFGVFIEDVLDPDLAAAVILPAGEGGTYDSTQHTVKWSIGELGPGAKGQRHFAAQIRADAPCGAEVTNFATVHFPSVPETTPTNGVSILVTGPSCDADGDGVLDALDDCPTMHDPQQEDADGDGSGDACDVDADADGMPNAYETLFTCLNPIVADAGGDPDNDGATNLREFQTGTPFRLGTNPCVSDPTPTATPMPPAATKCLRAIASQSSKFVQAKAKAQQSCEERKVKGKLPRLIDCHVEAKTAAQIAKATSTLSAKIGKACGGADKRCGDDIRNETGGASLGWATTCPSFESGACNGPIGTVDCTGIADCLVCIGEADVDQAIGLYYETLMPTNPQSAVKIEKALNKCQAAIGKGATKLLRAKSRALQKCWGTVLAGKAAAPCPNPGDSKALATIAKAEANTANAICKACGGGGDKKPADGQCDDPGAAFDPQGQIGFAAVCPSVEALGSDCGAIGAIDTLDQLVDCVNCVTEVEVECIDRVALPHFLPYPTTCR